MLKELRSGTKWILWIVVVAFVGSIGLIWGADVLDTGAGGNRSQDMGIIGNINGDKISAAMYSRAVEQAFAAYEAENGRRPSTEDDALQLREEAWEGLVADVLIAQQIRKRDIRVLDEEILMQVKGNPPAEVRRMEAFQTDGQFDHAKYLQALQDPRYDWRSLEYHVRSQIPRMKLEQEIISSVRVTEDEVRDAFIKQNVQVKVSYAFFGPSDFSDREVAWTDEELLIYYRSHEEDYRQPDQVSLRIVRWPKEPSPEDEQVVLEQLDEIYADLDKGEDFGELAEIYSDDSGSAEKGGDLGFFGRGEMVKEFSDAAFSLGVGQVGEPVKTRFGYHVIKVEDKDGDKVRARHILLELKPSRRTIEDIWTLAAAFDSAATKRSFVEAAEAAGLEIVTTDPFAEGGYIPGVGRSLRATRQAFKEAVDTVIGPFELSDAFIVAQVASRTDSRIPPFDDVRDVVTRGFETDQRREMAREKAEEVATQIAGGKTLEQAAPSESIRHSGPFSETSATGSVTADPAFIGTVFALPEDEMSAVLETRYGFAIARVDERTPLDEEAYANEKDSIKTQLLLRKQQTAFSLWFNQIYETAKIEDYRDRGPVSS